MLIGYVFIPLHFYTQGVVRIYIFGVGSGVARSVGVGNAKALYSGTSDEVQTLTLFSYLWEKEYYQLTRFAGEAQDCILYRTRMKELPEFTKQNYNIAGYVVGAAVTCSGAYLIYQILFNSDITFSANWNMFDSILIWPLYIIGLLVMFANWNLFSFSYDTYDKITYSDGHTEVKRNWDIIEWLIGHVLVPIFGRFFIVPILIAAIIYYPLMCIVHLVGAIFPYIVSLLVVGICVVSWMFTRWFEFRYHSWALVMMGIVFTAVFSWSAYFISITESGGNISLIADPYPTGKDNITKLGDGPTPPEGNDDEDEFGDDFGDDFGSGDDQFTGPEKKCLYGTLPEDTTNYLGNMEGVPIAFSIIKKSDADSISAVYEDLKSGTKMNLEGEVDPVAGCDIKFDGKQGEDNWTFNLTGTADNITGIANRNDEKEFKVTLRKKSEAAVTDDDDEF